MKSAVFVTSILSLSATSLAGPVVGLVDFDGTELGLTGYTNSVYTYAGPGFGTSALDVSSDAFGSSAWGGGDAYWPMTRAALGPNGLGMPFTISDDSVVAAAGNSVFDTDNLGFAGMAFENNGFFGVVDTENSMNTGPISSEFTFDISGQGGNLIVSADFVAMGDFELADEFIFEASIDGGAFQTIFASSVDENGEQTYMMDNPANNPVILSDPLYINGTILDDNYQTLSAAIAGSGNSLTIRFTAITNGSEGFGFDNLTVSIPAPGALALLGLAGLAGRRRRR